MSQIKVDSIIPRSGLGTGASGGVIQVISAAKTDSQTISLAGSSTTGNLSGLSPTITVTGSNKVLITGFISGDQGNSNYYNHVGVMIKRGSTVIGKGDADGNRRQIHSGLSTATGYYQGGRGGASACINFLDTPGAGTHTYNVELTNSHSQNVTVYVNRSGQNDNAIYRPRQISVLTLMEVSV